MQPPGAPGILSTQNLWESSQTEKLSSPLLATVLPMSWPGTLLLALSRARGRWDED